MKSSSERLSRLRAKMDKLEKQIERENDSKPAEAVQLPKVIEMVFSMGKTGKAKALYQLIGGAKQHFGGLKYKMERNEFVNEFIETLQKAKASNLNPVSWQTIKNSSSKLSGMNKLPGRWVTYLKLAGVQQVRATTSSMGQIGVANLYYYRPEGVVEATGKGIMGIFNPKA